ncbi:response regulator [Paenibacillus sp. N4]|uniref:response regulator transcription factor n=1 Tax=Paenibacillus vietnamensis TaxID=2590547 RepID=UPI001CD053D6|nr:response regulator [Paenibacillus vietnamensis]MCA0755667.1 response regulator [Paenibacillus vietnamensis]
MYSILLVDDETIELETIEHYVPWEKTGIKVVGTARNGKDALRLLAELKPDMVLTDVRMPIMDGLEFGRRAKQIDRNVKLIYLSGHNEFQYIKAALNVEAAGYLLKPIDMEELLALLEKVKKKCEEEQLAGQGGDWVREKLLLRLLREPDAEKQPEFAGKWELAAPEFSGNREYAAAYVTVEPLPGQYAALKTESAPADSFGERLRNAAEQLHTAYILAEPEPNAFLLLFRPKGEETAAARFGWERFRAQVAGDSAVQVTVGLSEPGSAPGQIREACLQARRSNAEKFYRLEGSVITPDEALTVSHLDEDADTLAAKLAASIQAGDAEQASKLAGGFFATIRDNRVDRSFAVRAVIRLLASLEQHFSALLASAMNELLLADHWKEISSMGTAAHIESYVLHICDEQLKAVSDREIDRNQAVAEQIAKIIAERHHQPLTVEEIAREVYLSPNYIRTIFKEKTGETILDYLTKVRMNHAAELLKDKSLKVREVSHKVGYENVSYFCSVFQKHRGSTPNEYRKMYL